MKYRDMYKFEDRVASVAKVLRTYPEMVPVVMEHYKGDTILPELTKKKYLVPRAMTVGAFIHVIRTRMKLDPSEAVFVFTGANGDIIPPTHQLMGSLYAEHKDPSGLLTFFYSGENVLG